MKLVADPPDDRRGLSPVVGIVLLFGMVLMGATLVAIGGMSMIDTMQTESSLDRAETSMQQVQSDLGELANSPDERRAEITLGNFQEGSASVVDDGEMRFTINPGSGCTASMDIGTLTYDRDGNTVGFQTGGVWRSSESGSHMVSRPDLSYQTVERNGETIYTVDFPATNVDPDDSSLSGDSVDARQNRTLSQQEQARMQKKLCLREEDDVRVHTIEIRLEGNQYADAWARYLESELNTDEISKNDVTVKDNGTVIAKAKLGADVGFGPEIFDIDNAVTDAAIRSTASEQLHLKNDVVVDSYDSSAGSYGDTHGENGEVVTADDMKLNNAQIEGNATAGGDIELQGGRSDVTGTTIDDAGVPEIGAIDDRVDMYLSDLSRQNNNSDTEAIDENELDLDGGETIESGVYYVDSFEANEELTIDTTSGDVVIAVEENVDIDADLHVRGASNEVRFFVGESIDVQDDVTVEGIGDDNDERSTGNWLFCKSDCDVSIGQGTQFVGTVYAPSPDGTGSFNVQSSNGRNTHVYGALVGGEATNIGTGAKFHYDTAVEEYGTSGGVNLDEGDTDTDGDEITVKGDMESYDVKTTLLGTELSGIDEYNNRYTHGQVAIDLRFDQPGQDPSVYQPWSNDAAQAGWSDDLNWPTQPEERTASYEGLKPNTSFTAFARSTRSCTEYQYYPRYGWVRVSGTVDAGTDTEIDGEMYDDYGCSLDQDPYIEINTDDDEGEELIKVLEDGDTVPAVDGANKGQRGIRDMLGDRVSEDKELQLENNEFVILFELSHNSGPSDGYESVWQEAKAEDGDPDFNDAALLYEITDVERETVARDPDEGSTGDGGSIGDTGAEDYSYTVNIENNQIVIGDD